MLATVNRLLGRSPTIAKPKPLPRPEALEALDALKRDSVPRLAELQEASSAADVELADAQWRVQEAQRRRARARHARESAQLSYDRELSRLESALRETADPQIEHAIESLRARHASLNGEIVHADTVVSPKGDNWFSGRVHRTPCLPNLQAVQERSEKIGVAIQDLEALKLRPLAGAELQGEIDRLVGDLLGTVHY